MIEDVSNKDLYQRHFYIGFKPFECDICNNPIKVGEDHIIESWHGEEVMVESRRLHKSCEAYIGVEIVDIDL